MAKNSVGIEIKASVDGTAEVEKLGKSLEGATKVTEGFGAKLDFIPSKLKAIAGAAAAYLGFSGFVNAVKGASDLEAKLSEVQAVSNATAKEMDGIRAAA